MARLAVITDRLPSDPSWKGAYIWQIILQLAESQHDVTVFTPCDPDTIEITHPRLQVARPAPAFTLDRLTQWAQALFTHRPEIIHTFALEPSRLWPKLTVWPYLDALAKGLPGTRRIASMFEAADFAAQTAALPWYRGSHGWTVFSSAQSQTARAVFGAGPVTVAPIDVAASATGAGMPIEKCLIAPAPVSEWSARERTLTLFAEHLWRHPDTVAHINGGWGSLPAKERRRSWSLLKDAASRVRLMEPMGWMDFSTRARGASAIWLEGLSPDNWRRILCTDLGHAVGASLIGGNGAAALINGSTTNFLSRLYAG